ncbi:MAG: serine hydrolase [Chloroflexota bacterium]
MRRPGSISALRWIAIFLIISAVGLLTFYLAIFSRLRSTYPPMLTIAGIPVGGLDRQEVAQRLLQVFSLPVELHYGSNVIHMDPAVAGFNLDLESMLAAADLVRTQNPFWPAFWDYLWNRPTPAAQVPLAANYSETRLRAYLQNEIAPRYDQPATPAQPIVGTINFSAGEYGTTLDLDHAVIVIDKALRSPNYRIVNLPLQRTQPPRPSLQNLRVLLQQTIDLAGFEGLVGVYLFDFQASQELHFLYRQGTYYPTNPDVAFTAASTIKIPIMISVYRRLDQTADAETLKLLGDMIEQSGNDPADWLMEMVIDPVRGPLDVTQDMQTLGLDNTFLAGFFHLGAPLLELYTTPANQRSDLDTDPDVYSQTTISDLGTILVDIYQCANTGGGALVAVFPNEITQAECQKMVAFLSRNLTGVLIEAGVPEGTQVAHKHGWVVDLFGVIRTIGDAAIVYTPGGNYVLVIFLQHPQQLIWEPTSQLVADLSRAVYNYFNLPVP